VPRHQLTLVVPKVSGPRGCAFSAPPGYDGLTRRDFLATSAATAIGALLVGCGGGKNLIGPPPPTGTITGDVVDLTGARQPSLGQIYLMYENGLQSGRSVAVDAAGRFAFSDVPTGPWQLRFHAPGIAYVPEEFPHPVRVTVTADRTTTVRIVTERGWEDGSPMVEIYIGDSFLPAQPLGSPTAEPILKSGSTTRWDRRGLRMQTTASGRWDHRALNRPPSYLCEPDLVGNFP